MSDLDQTQPSSAPEQRYPKVDPAGASAAPTTTQTPQGKGPARDVPTPVSLADYLAASDIHPVLVVGTQASGKTTMLQSLIYYMRNYNQNKAIDIQPGKSVFPLHYKNAAARHDEAAAFYNVGLSNFGRKRELADPTASQDPFFVPIDLHVTENDVTRIHRFAFYEGNGERFGKAGGAIDSPRFEAATEEFYEIVTKFTNPLSIMFLAPSVDGKTAKQSRDYAHQCLDNAITEFQQKRIDCNRDHAMLLLTKWDELFMPSDPKGHFSDADPDIVLEVMSRWQFVWPKFRGVKLDGPRAKALMPYSACWMNKDGQIVPPGPRYQPIFDKFNKTIWNWLYMNAVDAKRGQTGFDTTVIFQDVIHTKAKPGGIIWNLTKKALWA